VPQLPTVRPPSDDAFGSGDFLEAPDIEQVAEMLRERHNLPTEPTFAYRWKRKGGTSSDKGVLGKCLKLSGPAKHFAGVDFLIWLAADHCRDRKLDQGQYVNRVYHELLHAGVEYDDETGNAKIVVRGHDFEEFADVLRDYGPWNDDQADFLANAVQAPLWPMAAD
jgi:hypothetical protein